MPKYTQIFMLSIALCFICLEASSADKSSWIKKSQSVNGGWSIESRDGDDYLVFSDDFKTRKGPDLKLMLSNLSTANVNGENANEGAILIAPLKSSKGGQAYKLPERYTEYSTLLIHCEKYSKLWSASDLKIQAGVNE